MRLRRRSAAVTAGLTCLAGLVLASPAAPARAQIDVYYHLPFGTWTPLLRGPGVGGGECLFRVKYATSNSRAYAALRVYGGNCGPSASGGDGYRVFGVVNARRDVYAVPMAFSRQTDSCGTAIQAVSNAPSTALQSHGAVVDMNPAGGGLSMWFTDFDTGSYSGIVARYC
ncbi:hypothetical protein [Actinomadura rupiterrae]|uniref:hypothetical protein n=1 Tax=Actinomadura rupiterrae TaxID=559627 RepID=UPI0020A3DF65|nr:hypothetical protein [Actinomadura rupiterrae]MCP2342168.1 hypothetical protein [Actinomadura rupiterrae]